MFKVTHFPLESSAPCAIVFTTLSLLVTSKGSVTVRSVNIALSDIEKSWLDCYKLLKIK